MKHEKKMKIIWIFFSISAISLITGVCLSGILGGILTGLGVTGCASLMGYCITN